MTGSRRELVIVGAGIEGLMCAALAVFEGYRDVVVYDAPATHNLGPDSLRNHAWLQSGLLYSKYNKESALAMDYWGREMLRFVNVPKPASRGVFRLYGAEESEHFYAGVESLGLQKRVRKLPRESAERVAGKFWLADPAWEYWEVPDAPFKEELVLQAALEIGASHNVRYIYERVVIERDAKSPSGVAVRSASEIVYPEYLILAAGCGLKSLLDGLELSNPLCISRSPLLRVPIGNAIGACLLVDISQAQASSGLSIVQHSRLDIGPNGCAVIGSRLRTRLEPEAIQQRFVTKAECEAIWTMAPQLRPLETTFGTRFTAGHKAEQLVAHTGSQTNPITRSSIDPWIGTWPDFPRIVAVVPGKATLSYLTAHQVLAKLGSSDHGSDLPGPGQAPPQDPSTGGGGNNPTYSTLPLFRVL